MLRVMLRALLRRALVVTLCSACNDGPASASETSSSPTSSSTVGSTDDDTEPSSTTATGTATGTTTTTTATSESSSSTDTGVEASSGDAPDPIWRSALYPEDWTPDRTDDEGRFLHDFSYAGYRNGESAPGQDPPATVIDVVADHGADASGATDSTTALQAALDAAAALGGAVVLVPAGLYRVDGRLALTSSNTILRGVGADDSRLWFTRFAAMDGDAHLRVGASPALGSDVALDNDAPARATIVDVVDATDFAPGDDIAIGWEVSPEFIAEHDMDGTWMAFNGTWQVFFRRTVRAVDPANGEIEIDVPLRYPALARDHASVRAVSGLLREVGIEDLGIANAVGWDDAWSQNQVYAVEMSGVADAWIRGVHSFVSPGAPLRGLGAERHLQSGGITIRQSKRVTLDDVSLELAQNRGEGGNGYLFEIRQSSEVLVRDCVGRAGRHNFVQNWGFGATGIVWLRVHSSEGKSVFFAPNELATVGLSEFHHSLATANLVDDSVFDDGWGAVNRGSYSSGAGHSATQSVVWNANGSGVVRSRQFGHGYVIGTGDLEIETSLDALDAIGTAPEDWVEGPGMIGTLEPASLYEDQLARRLAR